MRGLGTWVKGSPPPFTSSWGISPPRVTSAAVEAAEGVCNYVQCGWPTELRVLNQKKEDWMLVLVISRFSLRQGPKTTVLKVAYFCKIEISYKHSFPGGSDSKEPACNAGDLGWKIPGEGKGYPLQFSCLKNPHGQKSLAGCGTRSREESDTT